VFSQTSSKIVGANLQAGIWHSGVCRTYPVSATKAAHILGSMDVPLQVQDYYPVSDACDVSAGSKRYGRRVAELVTLSPALAAAISLDPRSEKFDGCIRENTAIKGSRVRRPRGLVRNGVAFRY